MHDPELCKYVKFYVLECLRQLYYASGPKYGKTLSSIFASVRKLIERKTGTSEQLLNEAGLNTDIVLLVLNELVDEELCDVFGNRRSGWFYHLTQAGVIHVKYLYEPSKPF